MKNLIQYISAVFLCITAFSCTNDFLSEESGVSSLSYSTILISPNFGAKDYPIYIPGARNAKFSVIKTPDWLQVNTSSGNFNNDVAIINCIAPARGDFSDMGIYNDLMLLDITGVGKSLIPVSYISEGNPVIETEKNLYFPYYNSYYNTVPLAVKNTGQGILLFSIVEKPEWILFNEDISYTDPPIYNVFMIAPNSQRDFYLSYNIESLSIDDLKGRIVIKSNDKNNSETIINIQADMGEPSLYCYDNQLDFGWMETTRQINFSNYGNGLLTWKIESCPEWLSVSDTSGSLLPYSGQTLTFTCNRSLMPNGGQSQTIYLKTNDKNNPSYSITVTATNYLADPENIKAIEGTVTDAWMDKTADILYLTTSQPNRMLAYNMKTKSIDRELALSKAPNCFSVSEDGHKAVIGHGGLISLVDMDHFSVTKTFDIDYIISDIEWGADNWCCYTKGQGYGGYYLVWKNLDTGDIDDTENNNYNSLSSQTFLKKMPHRDYILAGGYFATIFSTQTHNYERQFSQNMDNFWFSSDGNYLFSSYNEIYKTPSFLSSSDYRVAPIGNFSPPPYQVYWIDHSAASHSIWVLTSSSSYYYEQQEIQQYEDNDYTRVNTYSFDKSYNGSPAQAQYVFANSAGSEVVVIKSNILNEWSIEHIPVTK